LTQKQNNEIHGRTRSQISANNQKKQAGCSPQKADRLRESASSTSPRLMNFCSFEGLVQSMVMGWDLRLEEKFDPIKLII
jgi:hypothetical protein